MRVGIVGAGMAGLACAEQLAGHGITPVLFDKGKRPGGRLSSLRLDHGSWDFGAPYTIANEPTYAARLKQWAREGHLAPWPAGPAGAMVGVPAMASLTEALCARHDVRFGSTIQRVESDGLGWYVRGTELCDGPFAALVIAVPAEQAAALLSLHDLLMAREAAAIRSHPCWSVMVTFAEPQPRLRPFLRDRGAIAWASRENTKPGRSPAECWVIQATADWSRAHLEHPREIIAELVLAEFAQVTGVALPPTTFAKAHRWRFATCYSEAGTVLWNPAIRLGACGDWCLPEQISGAWQSGVALAETMAGSLPG